MDIDHKIPGRVNRGWKGSVYLDHIGSFALQQVREGNLADAKSKMRNIDTGDWKQNYEK